MSESKRIQAIKTGIIDLGFMKMRVYVTAEGERFINADDMEKFFTDDSGNFTEEAAEKLAKGIKLGKFDSEEPLEADNGN